MKRNHVIFGIVFLLSLFLVCSNSIGQTIGRPSPATMYFKLLGYDSKEENGRTIVIFPDGSTAGEWAFYRGEVGEKWSYGARHGYHVSKKMHVTKSGNSYPYLNCIKYDSIGNIIEEIPQHILMKLNKVPFYATYDFEEWGEWKLIDSHYIKVQ